MAAYVLPLMSLVLVSAAWPTKDCGSVGGKVLTLDFVPAPVQGCTFPRGTNVTATMSLTMNTVTSSLTAVCKGDVVVWIPFNLPNPDACKQGVTCPTTAGQTYTFSTQIPILTEYPKIRLVVQLELKDDQGKDAICFQFPAQIC